MSAAPAAIEPVPAPAGYSAPEPDWQALARCNNGTGSMIALFFSESIDDINAAKVVCQGCPVREPCLAAATDRREPWGVWGGEIFLNGRILPFKRKRGRPPKVRPEASEEAISA